MARICGVKISLYMMVSTHPIRKALISVSDKQGLVELCLALKQYGVEIYSTSGTGKFLKAECGVAVVPIDSVTDTPEMLGGRVKTLHPKIFGGILARREDAGDRDEVNRFAIPLFDLVVVNLYPFAEHLKETPDEQSSFIDIGGPSMVRAAAKNSRSVAILSDPSDYADFLAEIKQHDGSTTREFRHRVAARAFQRTSAYDAMIAAAWSQEAGSERVFPTSLSLAPQKPLRYGENPHQEAAWAGSEAGVWRVLQGKELSYNNLLDVEAAYRLACDFSKPALAIIKHNNPCGVASGDRSIEALYLEALSCDSKSAFGGIVASNRPIDGKAALKMSELFLEVVIAPAFDKEALVAFEKKKNLRLIEWPAPTRASLEVRSVLGGWLLQTPDMTTIPPRLDTVTTAKVADEATWEDLKFAWIVCKHVRSNAIVIAKGGRTIGIGAGQMSRVDAVQIALGKSPATEIAGAVLASDAFFPFRDNIDWLKGKGITAVIQPGGSQRDGEVIQACNELGIAMVFTGERHFRH